MHLKKSIFDFLDVVHLPSRRATDEEILLIHDQIHLDFMKSIPSKPQKELNKMAERLDSIYINPDTLDCSLLSAGSLLVLVDAVCQVKKKENNQVKIKMKLVLVHFKH